MGDSVPVVDFRQLCEEEECKKVREACEKCGCFRIINHPISITLMADMKSVAKYLHDLPNETKKRNKAVISGSGYVPSSAASPLYEGLGIYDMCSSPQAVHNFCSELDLPPHHRHIIEAYGQAIHDLASIISQKMAESVGVVGSDFKDWPSIFRMVKYNFTPETVGELGVELHSDTGFITLLQDDEHVSGLEMMDDSGSFVAIPPKSGSFLCIIGDVAHAWSNGRFRNMEHRVICKETTTRHSFGTFMLASRYGYVEAPKELVDTNHERLYRPFKYEEFRELRITTGKRAGEVLEQFRIK
ncbi:2-oxoglutarate-dependent dioxygenase DAO-like [Gastrolobium bilobum]|uniref:2-oxoglutarate-dependent dioxygenase DAO-like n=1 Tax=Gastrolobium bilobum TaxID=150636 RepID=UPI002AAF5336|nr:2-oxoglutarate-dependent dioxygenase DAO-like [Gastrolobium bilobum]XP_061359762.1 2-oxoglutarate-dependent dioxygenase DAO-like [Gastrolobium bilobum]